MNAKAIREQAVNAIFCQLFLVLRLFNASVTKTISKTIVTINAARMPSSNPLTPLDLEVWVWLGDRVGVEKKVVSGVGVPVGFVIGVGAIEFIGKGSGIVAFGFGAAWLLLLVKTGRKFTVPKLKSLLL